MSPSRTPAPRLPLGLLVAVLLTVGVMIVDLGRPTWTEPVRRTASSLAGPVQSALTGLTDTRITELTQERNELAARVTELEAERRIDADLTALAQGASWGSGTLLPARVVGFAATSRPVASRTVAIDVGARDGLEVGQTVVDVDGLVGRVSRVDETSSEVQVLGDDQVVVAVRFGESGALGSVVSAAGSTPDDDIGADATPRGPDELTLLVLGDTVPRVGDEVITLGSPDGTPYAAQVPLGAVRAVDPGEQGRSATAVVTPHVNLDTLDLVAVIVDQGRR